jgi:hypothetical protein
VAALAKYVSRTPMITFECSTNLFRGYSDELRAVELMLCNDTHHGFSLSLNQP